MTLLWKPSRQRVEHSRMTDFSRFVASETGEEFRGYSDLHHWSIKQPGAFWTLLASYMDIMYDGTLQPALVHADNMETARWFPAARLNYAEHLLRHHGRHTALVAYNESGCQARLSFDQLRHQVAQLAAFFRANGLERGQVVAACLPNRAETVVAMLAAASLGAVFTSCSPDFGVQGILDRFGQTAPSVLLVTDACLYAGKSVDIRDKVEKVIAQMPSLGQVILVSSQGSLGSCDAVDWTSIVDLEQPAPALVFDRLPFNAPLFVMYSSGTTGKPKCIVHGHGGTLLQHLKELSLHSDVQARDGLFFFTTCGWMMWNWLVSGLALGARVVLFDGSPFHPVPDVLMDLADAEHVAVFGAGAKYFQQMQKLGLRPIETHSLRFLKVVLSTGSPLPHETFEYVYHDISPNVCLSSISGGTDIISCFALGNPNLPVYAGQLQCPGLGMATNVFDDKGQSCAVGVKGELVCTRPFPSMPTGFWNDERGERYHGAYFSRFNNVWAHGDFAERTHEGGLIIHGRSDAVLNPGGVRIGTAEIYRQVEMIPEVVEALAVGVRTDGDEQIMLFVRLQSGTSLTPALAETIRAAIRSGASPRHVPAYIHEVPDIPRTRSGKITELAVRAVIHGDPVKNVEALANPEALEAFSAFRVSPPDQ
jgi:acetoacetyl-CoA synthetase